MATVEVGKQLWEHPSKGHDRAFIDDTHNIYAVFDGAGDDRASQLAVDTIGKLAADSSEGNFYPWQAIGTIHNAILEEFGGSSMTTATIVHFTNLGRDGPAGKLEYSSAGDSRLSILNTRGSLITLTRDESTRWGNIIDASNFLGNPTHTLRQAGRIALNSIQSVVLTTDGVTDKDHEGSASPQDILDALLQHKNPTEAANQMVNATQYFDDATAIVINVCSNLRTF